MYRICSLSNSIHLKNDYLQQAGKGNERVEGVPSWGRLEMKPKRDENGNKKMVTKKEWTRDHTL
jgi:hypothetical protein